MKSRCEDKINLAEIRILLNSLFSNQLLSIETTQNFKSILT